MHGEPDFLRIGGECAVLFHIRPDDDIVFACFLEAAELFQAAGECDSQQYGSLIGDSEVLIRDIVEVPAIAQFFMVIAFGEENVA